MRTRKTIRVRRARAISSSQPTTPGCIGTRVATNPFMTNAPRRTQDALLSGIAGAAALTAVHQAAQRLTDSAPRMDVVGMRAIARGKPAAETASAGSTIPEPTNPALYNMALAGDLVFNSAYYSLATTWTRGAALGLLAGIGALVLPKKMGLGDPPKSELLSNQLMTVAWYTIGGLAAAWTAQCLATRRADEVREFVGGY